MGGALALETFIRIESQISVASAGSLRCHGILAFASYENLVILICRLLAFLGPASWIPDPAFRIPDPAFRILAPGSWVLDSESGSSILDLGSRILDTASRILKAAARLVSTFLDPVSQFWILDNINKRIDKGQWMLIDMLR